MTAGAGAPSNDDHRPGDTLRDGRFAVIGKLGEGGQGTTFEGIDKRDGRRVTLKRFRVRGASSWKEVELAEREAKVLAKVEHAGLPVYIDHFEEGGSLYLVTEYIEGQTVARLRADGPVAEAAVLRFLADAADALAYLHGRTPPVVHRDIKPSNVIRRPDGSFAIIDFGAVRDRLKVTGTTVVGTFGYMAPEQFQGRAMPSSDVYAVGATAVAMLTGAEPEDLPHKGLAIDVAAALPGARPDLVRALVAMLEPDPDRRASSIAPLLAGLRATPPTAGARGAPKAPDPAAGARPAKPSRDARGAEPPGPAAAPAGGATQGWGLDPDLQRGVDEAERQVKRAAAEIGETFMRVVDEVSRSSGHDLKREARRAAEVARDAIREAKRDATRERTRDRDARRRDRRAREQDRARDREARRAAEAQRREAQRRGAPLGGPILVLVLLALSIAQLAVLLALRVLTPLVLYLVSALFFGSVPGRAMRSAAGAVSQAGKRAIAAMELAKDVVRGRASPAPDAATNKQVRVAGHAEVDPHAPTHISSIGADEPAPARVDAPSAPPRARIAGDAEAEEEAEAEAEAAPGAKTKG